MDYTFQETYGTSQSDTTAVTPASGKKVYIWNAILEGVGTIDFLTSGKNIISVVVGGSELKHNANVEGAADEVVSITCDAGTKLTLLYDEL